LLLEELEARQLLSGFQPTASETLFLQLLNDARANPAAYGASIGVDLSYVAPAPPLAFNTLLEQAARLDAQDMNTRAFFGHTNPDGAGPGTRITNAGYVWTTWGESIAAGSTFPNPADALRALIIDAGVPDLGHRNHLLGIGSPDNLQREVGIGIVQNGTGPYQNYYVIDTATGPSSPAFLSGVVYSDRNGNGKYDVGEGLGGVTITVAGAGSVVSFDAGGYSIPLAPGTYTVTASGPGLPAPVTQVVTIGTANVRLDITPGPATGNPLGQWVARLYQDVLGRPASTSEINTVVTALANGLPRPVYVASILNSLEYDRRVVTTIYQQYLHRSPDPGGLASAVAALQGGSSEAAIRQAILSSSEYYNDQGGTPLGYVQGLFNDVLGRAYNDPPPGWVGLAATGNLAAVAAGILRSNEASTDVASALYRTYLRRDADPAGLASLAYYLAAAQLRHNGMETLLDSAEYFTGSLSG
jgi:uncharacterized protein YkwD